MLFGFVLLPSAQSQATVLLFLNRGVFHFINFTCIYNSNHINSKSSVDSHNQPELAHPFFNCPLCLRSVGTLQWKSNWKQGSHSVWICPCSFSFSPDVLWTTGVCITVTNDTLPRLSAAWRIKLGVRDVIYRVYDQLNSCQVPALAIEVLCLRKQSQRRTPHGMFWGQAATSYWIRS